MDRRSRQNKVKLDTLFSFQRVKVWVTFRGGQPNKIAGEVFDASLAQRSFYDGKMIAI